MCSSRFIELHLVQVRLTCVEAVGTCEAAKMAAMGLKIASAAELRPMHVCNLCMTRVCSLQLSKLGIVRLYGVGMIDASSPQVTGRRRVCLNAVCMLPLLSLHI